MTEIIDYWMRSCGGRPTWRELADALKRIKEDSLAQQLMSIYDTGERVVVTMTASVSCLIVMEAPLFLVFEYCGCLHTLKSITPF